MPNTFPESVAKDAFKRSGGRCECTREHSGKDRASHNGGRCPIRFTQDQRGKVWELHHYLPVGDEGTNEVDNAECICRSCHRLI